MPATPATELVLVELFSSLQGEGIFLGRRQIFVRLADCNLSCAYCDTAHRTGPTWLAELQPGQPETAVRPNPVAAAELTALVSAWQEQLPCHHSLALTGGEPLLQWPALVAWLPGVSRVLPIYLETNGTLPEALSHVLPWISWVSMDIKLARSTGMATTPWAIHEEFLRRAGSRLCQVKTVIDADTREDDLVAAANLVANHAPECPLILQPRTVAGRPVVAGWQLLLFQAIAARVHRPALVIPQLHPLLAIR